MTRAPCGRLGGGLGQRLLHQVGGALLSASVVVSRVGRRPCGCRQLRHQHTPTPAQPSHGDVVRVGARWLTCSSAARSESGGGAGGREAGAPAVRKPAGLLDDY
jgi:hypothetical protein